METLGTLPTCVVETLHTVGWRMYTLGVWRQYPPLGVSCTHRGLGPATTVLLRPVPKDGGACNQCFVGPVPNGIRPVPSGEVGTVLNRGCEIYRPGTGLYTPWVMGPVPIGSWELYPPRWWGLYSPWGGAWNQT